MRGLGFVVLFGVQASRVGIVDEVVDGGWGAAGNVLTAAMLNDDA